MIEKSFAWAATQGRTRVNEIHGEEEARLILEDYFEDKATKGESLQIEGSGEFEARGCYG